MLNNVYVLVYNITMNKSFVYLHNNQEYVVNITYKRIRNIHYRYKDGAFFISCHRLTPMHLIKSGLDKYADKLIKRNAKEQGEGVIDFKAQNKEDSAQQRNLEDTNS